MARSSNNSNIIRDANAKYRAENSGPLPPRELAERIAKDHPGVNITPQYISVIRSKEKLQPVGKAVKPATAEVKVSSPAGGKKLALKRVSRSKSTVVEAAPVDTVHDAFEVVGRVTAFIRDMGGVDAAERAIKQAKRWQTESEASAG